MTADLGPAATPRPIPTPEDRMPSFDDFDRITRQRDDLRRELTQSREALARAGIEPKPTASTPDLIDLLANERDERLTLAESSRLAKRYDEAEQLAQFRQGVNDSLRQDLSDAGDVIAVVREAVERIDRALAAYDAPPSLGSQAARAQDPAEPAQDAQDGPAAPGEGERTQEAADAHLGEPAGYAIVATRLHRGERGELLDGDVVASAVSARPTLGEAIDELRRVIAPAHDDQCTAPLCAACGCWCHALDAEAADRAPDHDHTTGYPIFAPDAELVVNTADGPAQWTGAEWNAHVHAATKARNGVLERLIICPPHSCTTTCPAERAEG